MLEYNSRWALNFNTPLSSGTHARIRGQCPCPGTSFQHCTRALNGILVFKVPSGRNTVCAGAQAGTTAWAPRLNKALSWLL